jgi:hypothetical protein
MRFCFTSKARPCDTRGVSLTDKGAREQCVAFRGVVSGLRGEIFQQSMNKWYRSPEKAEGDKSVRDTVTTKKNKMGAACKTSVALRAGAGKGWTRTRTRTRTRLRTRTRWCVCVC